LRTSFGSQRKKGELGKKKWKLRKMLPVPHVAPRWESLGEKKRGQGVCRYKEGEQGGGQSTDTRKQGSVGVSRGPKWVAGPRWGKGAELPCKGRKKVLSSWRKGTKVRKLGELCRGGFPSGKTLIEERSCGN